MTENQDKETATTSKEFNGRPDLGVAVLFFRFLFKGPFFRPQNRDAQKRTDSQFKNGRPYIGAGKWPHVRGRVLSQKLARALVEKQAASQPSPDSMEATLARVVGHKGRDT